MTHEDTVRCIELMGKEVLPALQSFLKEESNSWSSATPCLSDQRSRKWL